MLFFAKKTHHAWGIVKDGSPCLVSLVKRRKYIEFEQCTCGSIDICEHAIALYLEIESWKEKVEDKAVPLLKRLSQQEMAEILHDLLNSVPQVLPEILDRLKKGRKSLEDYRKEYLERFSLYETLFSNHYRKIGLHSPILAAEIRDIIQQAKKMFTADPIESFKMLAASIFALLELDPGEKDQKLYRERIKRLTYEPVSAMIQLAKKARGKPPDEVSQILVFTLLHPEAKLLDRELGELVDVIVQDEEMGREILNQLKDNLSQEKKERLPFVRLSLFEITGDNQSYVELASRLIKKFPEVLPRYVEKLIEMGEDKRALDIIWKHMSHRTTRYYDPSLGRILERDLSHLLGPRDRFDNLLNLVIYDGQKEDFKKLKELAIKRAEWHQIKEILYRKMSRTVLVKLFEEVEEWEDIKSIALGTSIEYFDFWLAIQALEKKDASLSFNISRDKILEYLEPNPNRSAYRTVTFVLKKYVSQIPSQEEAFRSFIQELRTKFSKRIAFLTELDNAGLE